MGSRRKRKKVEWTWPARETSGRKKNDRRLEVHSKLPLDVFTETKTFILGAAADNSDAVDPGPTMELAQCH